MSTLYLHIGGPKTGSTWIQSVFRINREMMSEHKIFYPQGSEWIYSTPTSWTSGNGAWILDSSESLAKALEVRCIHPEKSVLYSSEMLIEKLANESTIPALSSAAQLAGYSRISVLYLLRNPVSFSVSAWHQHIKYFGSSMSLDEFILQTEFMINKYQYMLAILKQMKEDQSIHLKAFNYSRQKSNLKDVIANWLSIPVENFQVPDANRINRSLTDGELRLQLSFNRILGGDAHFISRALTETLTELKSADITPRKDTQRILWDRTSPIIEQINHFLDPEQQIEFDQIEYKSSAEKYCFSAEQIEVIASTLAMEIQRLKEPSLVELTPEKPIIEPAHEIKKKSWINRLVYKILPG